MKGVAKAVTQEAIEPAGLAICGKVVCEDNAASECGTQQDSVLPAEVLWSSCIRACSVGDGSFITDAGSTSPFADISASMSMPGTVRP